jgi:hypothetical protein
MQYHEPTGRAPAVLDLSSPEITIGQLAQFALMMRNAQYDVEAAGASDLWADTVMLRTEVRAAFLKRYLRNL